MSLLRVLVITAVALPVWAQYAGPAILSRGQVPIGMRSAQISFRPFLEVSGVYDTGLTGVSVVDQYGNLTNESGFGIEGTAGVSGFHTWKHTSLGLDYRGSYRAYTKQTYYSGTDQYLDLGLSHQFTRHTEFVLRESAGLYSRDFGLVTLHQAVPFDRNAAYIPTTDFFDNRTLYFSTQADFIYQRSARLSFDLGGDFFSARYRSSALYSTTGQGARGDMQYRIARYTTIGLNYQFSHFNFGKGFGGSDLHSLVASYSVRITRNLEFSAYAGAVRVETKYIQVVPLDPVIAAIIGQGSGETIQHRTDYSPDIGARIARTFRNGVFSLSGGRVVTPGNGLFLTSISNSAAANYAYTGLRRWSFLAGAYYNRSIAISNVNGHYESLTGGVGLSRQIARSVHFTARFDARKYNSSDFNLYNRVIYRATIGMGFSPGDVPLRIW